MHTYADDDDDDDSDGIQFSPHFIIICIITKELVSLFFISFEK